MLTQEGCRRRLERLVERIENPWDVLIVHRPEHLLYFANLPVPAVGLNAQSSSFLVVERDGGSTLFVDNWRELQDLAVDAVHVSDWYDFRSEAKRRATIVAESVCEHLRQLGTARVAAELAVLPVQIAAVTDSIIDIEPQILSLRELKDDDEIEAIRRGVRTAEAVHAVSRELLEAGLTELEYYGRLQPAAIAAAGEPFVMMCDLVSGPRAAAGSGPPSTRRMESGDLVILDIFPYVGGYRGDITNTLVVGGEPTAEQAECFDVTLQALETAEKLLRPGVSVREIYDAIGVVLREASKPLLPRHAGHGLGLDHPEVPAIVKHNDRLVERGMVLALEPGIYEIEGGGLRLEHNYWISADGVERLSNHQLGLSSAPR